MEPDKLKPSMVYLTDEQGLIVIKMPVSYFAVIAYADGMKKLEVTFREVSDDV